MSAPPSPPAGPDDGDVAAAVPGAVIRVASGLVMVSGLATGLVGVQNLVGFQMFGLYYAMLVSLVALGCVAVVVGWVHGKGRAWAAVAGLVVSVAMAVGSLSWLVVSLAGGGLSLMAFLAVALSGITVVVVPFSLGPCRRVTAAQERLRDAGLDLGL